MWDIMFSQIAILEVECLGPSGMSSMMGTHMRRSIEPPGPVLPVEGSQRVSACSQMQQEDSSVPSSWAIQLLCSQKLHCGYQENLSVIPILGITSMSATGL